MKCLFVGTIQLAAIAEQLFERIPRLPLVYRRLGKRAFGGGFTGLGMLDSSHERVQEWWYARVE